MGWDGTAMGRGGTVGDVPATVRAGRRLRLAAWLVGPAGLVVLVGALVWLITGFTSATVSSDNMRPTYTSGDLVFTERIDGSEVRRGDVVLFTAGKWAPEGHEGDRYLMRVIALGGDVVTGGHGAPVAVNGERLDEPYRMKGSGGLDTGPTYSVSVPDGRMFLLGDHRANSNDSRYRLAMDQGTLPVSAVDARVLDGPGVPLTLAGVALVGLLTALTGLGLAIAARVARSRAKRAARPAHQYAVMR